MSHFFEKKLVIEVCFVFFLLRISKPLKPLFIASKFWISSNTNISSEFVISSSASWAVLRNLSDSSASEICSDSELIRNIFSNICEFWTLISKVSRPAIFQKQLPSLSSMLLDILEIWSHSIQIYANFFIFLHSVNRTQANFSSKTFWQIRRDVFGFFLMNCFICCFSVKLSQEYFGSFLSLILYAYMSY